MTAGGGGGRGKGGGYNKKIVFEWGELTFAGHFLDLSCIQQSDAAHFCENFAKLCFHAKHLEK